MAESHALDIVMTPLDVEPDVVRESATLLSWDERHRASRFTRDCDRRRFTVSRGRLRQLLGQRLDVPPDAIELVYGIRGKPRLAARLDSSLRFNVSHCGDVAAFAFVMGREVGIDIEAVRKLPDADAIAALAFSAHELEEYRTLAAHQKPLGFFNCWTRKEALVKAWGDGLGPRLDRFDVSLAPGAPPRLLRVDGTNGQRSGWAIHAFAPGPGMVGAVAVSEPVQARGETAPPVRIRMRSLLRNPRPGSMTVGNAA